MKSQRILIDLPKDVRQSIGRISKASGRPLSKIVCDVVALQADALIEWATLLEQIEKTKAKMTPLETRALLDQLDDATFHALDRRESAMQNLTMMRTSVEGLGRKISDREKGTPDAPPQAPTGPSE